MPDNLKITNYGKALKAERLRLELTQQQLAKQTGTSQQNIAGIEAGKSVPKPALHAAFCDLFGLHSVMNNVTMRGAVVQIETTKALKGMRQAPDVTDVQVRDYTTTNFSEMAQEIARMFDEVPKEGHQRPNLFSRIVGMLTPAVRDTQA